MNTDYIDALKELDYIIPNIDLRSEQQKDYESIDEYNKKEIWEYVYKYFMPKNKKTNLGCKIGLHTYRGYNRILYLDTKCNEFYGICIKCGKERYSGINAVF